MEGIARHIWKGIVFKNSPFLRNLLRWFKFFERFSFIDDLIRLVWCVRAKFATMPAVFGVVLSCCSLFPGKLPILQSLPFAKDFENFEIPIAENNNETAYHQIPAIINSFVKEYNRFVDSLSHLGCNSITELRPSELLPHMTITLKGIKSLLGEIAGSSWENDLPLEDALIGAFRCPEIPLCRFSLPESQEKDFWGFTEQEWGKIFENIPLLKSVVAEKTDSGYRPSQSKPLLEFRYPEEFDLRRGLICLCFLYSPPGSFEIRDFCSDEVPLARFLDATPTLSRIEFSQVEEEFGGPVRRFIPQEIKEKLFTKKGAV
jgi:hypothetical protein